MSKSVLRNLTTGEIVGMQSNATLPRPSWLAARLCFLYRDEPCHNAGMLCGSLPTHGTDGGYPRIHPGQLMLQRRALNDFPSSAAGRAASNVVMMGMGEVRASCALCFVGPEDL